jgi:pseudaminic acid biosynthesis-associated methylase
MADESIVPEAKRLENLWSGEFGDAYVDRNLTAYTMRARFWSTLLDQLAPCKVLEIGANVGGNLESIVQHVEPAAVYGVDVNRKALAHLKDRVEGVNAVWSPARELPFRDKWFDLVFTMGVLIHQPNETLPLVMSEMVRCSSRWILCGEYFAATTEEVPYRDQPAALFRRDYGQLFQSLFQGLELRDEGFLGRDEGWDDVTWWLFERQR